MFWGPFMLGHFQHKTPEIWTLTGLGCVNIYIYIYKYMEREGGRVGRERERESLYLVYLSGAAEFP